MSSPQRSDEARVLELCNELLAERDPRATPPADFGYGMCAPTILMHGDDAQSKQ